MNTQNLFARIATELPGIAGWCEPEKAMCLAAAVLTLRPRTIVEIGVFGGRSLIPMALAAQAIGDCKVWAIDPWAAPAATEGYSGANQQWWASRDYEGIHAGFLGHLDRLGLRDVVQVVRAKSDDVPVPADIGLLHVDGQHTEQALRDVNRYAVNVTRPGACFLDDIDWANDGRQDVKRAAFRLTELRFIQAYRIGTGACFLRV